MNQFDAQIKAALLKLDPKDDSHWTQNGSPVIQVVSELSQINGLKRADITNAAPTFTRDNPTFEAPAETQEPAEGEASAEEKEAVAEANAEAAESTLSEDETAALEGADEEEEAEGEDEGATLDDGLSESEAELAEAEAILAAEQEKAAEAQKKVAAAAAKRDAILEERAKDVHPHQNQIDIMAHLESQKQLRILRAERAQQVLVIPRAPIDQAMARKKGFGHARPKVPLKTGA